MKEHAKSGAKAISAEIRESGLSDVSANFPTNPVAPDKIKSVNYNLKAKISAAFNYACRVARPWSDSPIDLKQGERPYLGREAELHMLLGYRVGRSAIRNWRYGVRKPPRWAIDVLLGELQAIENRCREARQRLMDGL